MTMTFATNASNDIFLGSDGNLAIVRGLPAVEAGCQTASQAQLGEMILAITSGIPNFGTVWVGSPNLSIFEAYLRKTLLGVDGVIEVTTLTTRAVNGQLQYTATIRSKYGPLEVNG